MKKKTKAWLIIATTLLIVGAALFAGAMSVLHWDFSKLDTSNLIISTHTVHESFHDINIQSNTADVVFAVSDDGGCKVVCEEEESQKHTVTVENDTLTVKATDARKWYESIGIHFKNETITVYLPEGEYNALFIKSNTGNVTLTKDFSFANADLSLNTGDFISSASVKELLKISTSTGDVTLKSMRAGTIDFSSSTGNGIFSDIVCSKIMSKASTGNFSLLNVNILEELKIERSTGNVKLTGSDAPIIYVKTSTGNVTGSFPSDKIFVVESSTGEVQVPKTTSGGTCEIITSTGDIIFH